MKEGRAVERIDYVSQYENEKIMMLMMMMMMLIMLMHMIDRMEMMMG